MGSQFLHMRQDGIAFDSLEEDVYHAGLHFLAELVAVDAGVAEVQAWILEEVRKIVGAISASLYLCEESNVNCLNKKTQSEDGQLSSQLIPLDATSLLFEALQTEGHLLSPGISGISTVYIPLIADGARMGVLELESEHERFDEDLVVAIGESLAYSLTKSRQARQARETIQAMQTFQDQLLNSRNTLRALFDSSPTSIYIIDPVFTLIAINMRRANITGSSPQRLVGKKCFVTLYNREEPCPGCLVGKTFQTGEITRRNERCGGEEAEPIELEISTFPIWDNENQVVQAFLFEEDVTERQHMQATLAQSEKLAAVGQLAAGVAHEINNPLTTILANAQLLQRSLPSREDELQEMVELIIQASDRASRAVGDLLDFARRERYEFAPTDLNETIQRTLALMGHELGSRTISLQFDPALNLPTINANQDQLQGIWLNLLLNAIDAIDQGPGMIWIKTMNCGDSVQVFVTDNGVGIPADKIRHIFEPFYTTKGPGYGTGLGLSVCHQIITRHGGQIHVSSQPDEGTTFTVTLPLA
jgi:two-component system NtrC family sensor kinase